MAAVDFIIAFFADSPMLRAVALNHLKGPTLIWTPQVSGRKYREFVQGRGNSVQAMFEQAKKNAGDTLGRVAVLGFSEGCQGVGATLQCSDASGIDTVIACDGIHTQYTDPVTHAINPANLGQYIAYAKAVVGDGRPSENPDGRVLAITHSSIQPPYASTTETAELIWAEAIRNASGVEDAGCGWGCPAALLEDALASVHWPDGEFPIGSKPGGGVVSEDGWTTIRPSAAETNFLPSAPFTWTGIADGWTVRRQANGLSVFGWSYPTKNRTKDPTGNRDHIFQAQMVLPYVARRVLVDRWNPDCAVKDTSFEGETVGPYYAGFGASTCDRGRGRRFGDAKREALPNLYPLGVGTPKKPPTCPVPPPGKVIVGGPGNPCLVSGTPEAEVDALAALKVFGVMGGGVLGFWAARRLLRGRGARRVW